MYINYKTMNEIDILATKYAKKSAEVKKIRERIKKLEAKRDKFYSTYWFWTNRLVKPIMKMIKARFPEIVWEDDRLVPLGLMNRVSVFGKYKGETLMLSFLPSDTEHGRISFETDKKVQDYPENSIGAWNHMGYEQIELNDIQQLYDYVQKQMKNVEEKQ